MKNVIFVFAAFLASASAFAAPAGPVVVKTSYSGFVPEEYVRFETCEMHADKVVIERGYASLRTREVREVQVTGDFAAVIAGAAQEAVEEQPGRICDAPSTGVYARLSADDREGEVVLFTSGGCGTPRRERTGPAAAALRQMIDQYCPTTHDFGAER